MRFLLVLAGLLSLASAANAQGYVINTPGRAPAFISPTYGGGYVVNTPGQSAGYANPGLGGGYVINTPGQYPTLVTPADPQSSGFYGLYSRPSGGIYGR
jgi:hypothetical protein